MIGYYNYTVVLTYLGTISGFTGIASIYTGNLKIALLCLMFSGLCDMFDGKIASTMERTKYEKSFGIQIDSLSDLICFGVLPAMIFLYCSGTSYLYIFLSANFVLCALIRLAWFNVEEEYRQTFEKGCRETYTGLPVTSAALLLPFFIGVSHLLNFPVNMVASLLLICVGTAFLLPFQLRKPDHKGKQILMILGLICLAVVLVGI